jgi:hypothetical protein
VTRRAFLGASIAAFVAALSLPFGQFAEWCKAWLGSRESVVFLGREVMHFEAGQWVTWNLDGPFAGMPDNARYGTARITSIDRTAGTLTVAA